MVVTHDQFLIQGQNQVTFFVIFPRLVQNELQNEYLRCIKRIKLHSHLWVFDILLEKYTATTAIWLKITLRCKLYCVIKSFMWYDRVFRKQQRELLRLIQNTPILQDYFFPVFLRQFWYFLKQSGDL